MPMDSTRDQQGNSPQKGGKRTKLVRIYFTAEEFQTLEELAREQGASLPHLARSRILNGARERVVNARQLISILDAKGAELGRACQQISMLASYTETLKERGLVCRRVAEKFNGILESYVSAQQGLEMAIRQIIRQMAK
jgi:hypothetical protein